MSAKNVGIIYSANQQVIRRTIDTRIELDANGNRIIVPGDDKHLTHHQNAVLDGEVWTTVPCAIYDTHSHVLDTHAYLGLSGIPGVTDRHALVDESNTVQAVVLVDPAVDAPPTPIASPITKGMSMNQTLSFESPTPQFSFVADPDGDYQAGDIIAPDSQSDSIAEADSAS